MPPAARRPSPPLDPDDVEAATAAALRVLAAAAQTEAGLRRRLERRGFGAAAAAAAAARAASLGYVDDDAFAQALAGRRLARGYGRAAIAAELRGRGVAERPLDDALRGVGLDDERAAASRLARRLWERELARPRPDDGRRRHRVAAALGRRGYGGEVVVAALRGLGAASVEDV